MPLNKDTETNLTIFLFDWKDLLKKITMAFFFIRKDKFVNMSKCLNIYIIEQIIHAFKMALGHC